MEESPITISLALDGKIVSEQMANYLARHPYPQREWEEEDARRKIALERAYRKIQEIQERSNS